MNEQLLMGNQAIAAGAISAGANLVSGYPGTPSTEALEYVAGHNPGDIHVEWSTNEKAALEVAAGASYSGARTLVTMKQMGLDVASDPLMCLAYIGVKGGMVLLVADDPGPISSQTEQDTRTFASYARLPIFDPSTPEEAYQMTMDAFELSERCSMPVIVRPTTRVCHATAPIDVLPRKEHEVEGFERNPGWVIFPGLSYRKHLELDRALPALGDELSDYDCNACYDVLAAHAADGDKPRVGIATGGVSDAYAQEALNGFDVSYRLLHVATPNPFPEKLALEFLDGLDEVLVSEELDPVIEKALIFVCGRYHLPTNIRGKLSGDARAAGENSVESVSADIAAFFGVEDPVAARIAAAKDALAGAGEPPALPVRPPVLCAGCPHRGSFYAVKRALKGRKAFFMGDIGCYTLGNAAPLDMVDTCLCMGADVTLAQGMSKANPDAKNIAFIGDSTFFASGITGVINAFYNKHDITVVVLDNSTTAMTGQQPHPGTGKTMMGTTSPKVSIDAILRGIGLACVEHANPFDLEASVAAVERAVDYEGVSAVIFEQPCINLRKPDAAYAVDQDKCRRCRRCISEIGCPAISRDDGGAISVDASLCYGCGLCAQVCPFDALAPVPDASTSPSAGADASTSPSAGAASEGGAR